MVNDGSPYSKICRTELFLLRSVVGPPQIKTFDPIPAALSRYRFGNMDLDITAAKHDQSLDLLL